MVFQQPASDFVDDQEIHLGQASLQVGEPQAGLGFGQLVDKTGGCQEAYFFALLADQEPQSCGQMGLAPGALAFTGMPPPASALSFSPTISSWRPRPSPISTRSTGRPRSSSASSSRTCGSRPSSATRKTPCGPKSTPPSSPIFCLVISSSCAT